MASQAGVMVCSLFKTRTLAGRPFKFLIVLLSLFTLPFGAFLWLPLVRHGVTIYTQRNGEIAAEKFNLKGAPMFAGTSSGLLIDEPGRRLVIFGCISGLTVEVSFAEVESWHWEWTTKGGARTENTILLKTTNDARPIVKIGELSEAGAEHWHQRLGIVLNRA